MLDIAAVTSDGYELATLWNRHFGFSWRRLAGGRVSWIDIAGDGAYDSSVRRVVVDTNVLVAALRSRRGRSNRLISLVGAGRFRTVITVPLVLEYEDAALRQEAFLSYSAEEVREIIDFICRAAEPTEVYYLWRPFLPDPKDDLVLEAAVAGRCDTIVTFDARHFRGVELFGLELRTPRAFLEEIER